MYVLIDMEWVTNRHGNHWPTQLAAIRVDEEWQTVDSFSVLFRPKDITFQKWDHMAFSGWTRDNFLNADSLYPALDAFEHWLQPEDILCWWHQEAYDLYIMFTKVAQIRDRASMVVFLSDYIYGFLPGQKGAVGSPYKICAARDIPTPEPAHCSINDVLAIQALVQSIDFQQRNLQAPPKKWVKDTTALKGSPVFPLLYDTSTQLLHHSDCELLPDNRYLPAYTSFKAPIRKRYKPCACCHDEFLDALWDRNQDSITRSDYNYVYSKQSKVFHTRNCSHVLLSFDIQGTVSYETCLKSGRRPCKHCKPVPIERKRISLPIKQNKPQKAENRNLNGEERKALGRFKRAKEERETAFKRGDLTEAERNTVMALSQPGLAFWASKGYSTFHTRNCSKITGLNQLRGFARYQDAVRAGYSPCRHCRPSPKQDVKFSIPITNKERHGETTDTLIQLCTQHCLPFEYDMRYFTLQTMAGKWRIDMSLRPVRLEHINLVTERGSTKKFHTQPRLFLSLKDTFDYIMRHDSKLIEEIVAKDNQSQELAMG